MWVEIICGLVIHTLFRRYFHDDDDLLELEATDSNALFSVATRLEMLYGGKVYVGLRIPDAYSGSRQNIDLVLVNKGEAVVTSVQNLSGLVSIDAGGSWVLPVEIATKLSVVQILWQKLNNKLLFLNPILNKGELLFLKDIYLADLYVPTQISVPIHSEYFPSEVVTYEQWVQLKPEPKSMFSGWIKGAFCGGKKDMQEPIHLKLNFILATAPTWDSGVSETCL